MRQRIDAICNYIDNEPKFLHQGMSPKACKTFYRIAQRSKQIFHYLASCNYSKATQEWYSNHQVEFIAKIMNPPNSPELRPIAKYWEIVKRMLFKHKLSVENTEMMRRKWIQFPEKVSADLVQRLIRKIKNNSRYFVRS